MIDPDINLCIPLRPIIEGSGVLSEFANNRRDSPRSHRNGISFAILHRLTRLDFRRVTTQEPYSFLRLDQIEFDIVQPFSLQSKVLQTQTRFSGSDQ